MDALNRTRGPDEAEYLPIDKTSFEDLPRNLSKLFMAARKKDGGVYNGASLGTHYQSICRYFRDRTDGPNLNIKQDPRFDHVRRVLASRQEFSAKHGAIPGINASDAVPSHVMAKLFEDGLFGKTSPRSLIRTIAFILNTQMGCRTKTVRMSSFKCLLFSSSVQLRYSSKLNFYSLELDTEVVGLVDIYCFF